MNERIKEFVEQAGLKYYNWITNESNICNDNFKYPRVEDYEKFAELIVKECSAVANHFSDGYETREFDNSKRYLYFVDIGKIIKEHFGVEE